MVFGQFSDCATGMYMAVTDRLKYIYSAPDRKEWLFDLRTDPEETRNRLHLPMYKEQAARMRRELIALFTVTTAA
jgi:arylsulfatase A-like enzyme